MKLYGCKKGSLNLSINAIVVLILAITMLGLGLSFMKNIFGGATEEFKKVGGTVEKQMIEQMKESPNIVELSRPSIDLKKAGKDQIFIGLKNVQAGPQEFVIITPDKSDLGDDVTCSGGIDPNIGTAGITIEYKQSETKIASGQTQVLPINVKSDSNVAEGTCFVDIVVCQGEALKIQDIDKAAMKCLHKTTGLVIPEVTEHHAELTIDVGV